MNFQQPVRYHEVRQMFLDAIAKRWIVYYKGNLAVRRKHNREVELIARLVFGLNDAGKAFCCHKRNVEGVMEYQVFPRVKLTDEDLDEAMQLTKVKADALS